MSWALIAVSGIDGESGSIMAATADIIEVLKGEYAEQLTIFTDEPGVYLWMGCITVSDDGVECEQRNLVPLNTDAIDDLLKRSGSVQ
ncbi:MAG: hypothetical protein WKG03_08920 [Telluria sp.]